ncbi:unnamed protein product [Camellia sinensis]
MSRARDIDTGLDDKKGKRMKTSEEEEKAKDVSKAGNAEMSSTPSHTVNPPAGPAPGEESKLGQNHSSWWEGYVANHNLVARDLIQFYRPVPRTGNNHYLIKHLPLTTTDVTSIKTSDDAFKLKWLHFTDAEGNESWRMLFKFDNDSDGYTIVNGLEKFLRWYKLRTMDLIKLYKPVKPLNAHHFIIDYEKREEANEKPATERGTDHYPGNGSGGVD